jgi:hypothetical protein
MPRARPRWRTSKGHVARPDEEPDVAGVRFAKQGAHPVSALFEVLRGEEAAEGAGGDVRPPQEVRACLRILEVGAGGGEHGRRG